MSDNKGKKYLAMTHQIDSNPGIPQRQSKKEQSMEWWWLLTFVKRVNQWTWHTSLPSVTNLLLLFEDWLQGWYRSRLQPMLQWSRRWTLKSSRLHFVSKASWTLCKWNVHSRIFLVKLQWHFNLTQKNQV